MSILFANTSGLAAAFSTALAVLLCIAAFFSLRVLLQKFRGTLFEDVCATLYWPVQLIIVSYGLMYAVAPLALFYFDFDLIYGSAKLMRVLSIIAVTWALMRYKDHCFRRFIDRADPSSAEGFEVISKFATLGLGLVGFLTVLGTMGVELSAILAFGGLGGLTAGLAAKEFLANVFGALAISISRPFSPGDHIILHASGLEGTVQDIGWVQTRLLSLEKEPFFVPNSLFGTQSVINCSRRTNRRIHERISLRAKDLGSLETITIALKNTISKNSGIDKTLPVIVALDRYGTFSPEVLVIAYPIAGTLEEYHILKQQVLLDAYRVLSSLGAELDFTLKCGSRTGDT